MLLHLIRSLVTGYQHAKNKRATYGLLQGHKSRSFRVIDLRMNNLELKKNKKIHKILTAGNVLQISPKGNKGNGNI